MNLILTDTTSQDFYPLAFTRPVGAIRVGVFTIAERWKQIEGNFKVSYHSSDYLRNKFRLNIENDNLLVNSAIFPEKFIANEILKLLDGQALFFEGKIIAVRISGNRLQGLKEISLKQISARCKKMIQLEEEPIILNNILDLFKRAGDFIQKDFEFLGEQKGLDRPKNNSTIIGNQLLMKKTASVSASIINTETGPVILDRGAQILEGCIIRGPLYLGANAVLKMGAKIYGPTIIGPHCKVGGEVNNSFFHGFSNKGHDGFLGNSVIGEWCNLGADTNTSNLKNNYGDVKRWNYTNSQFENSGLQFCGLTMGDHSKTAINSQLNTGTVLGAFVNTFSSGFPPKYLPCFTWFGDEVNEKFDLAKAYEVAERMMERRGHKLSRYDKNVYKHLFDQGI